MKTILRILGGLLILVAVIIVAGLAFLFLRYPRAEEPANIQVEMSPERLERGKYLVNSVVACVDCHSERDFRYYAAPTKPGGEGAGALFTREKGLGEVHTPNITPHALKNWSDGEIIRAVTSGINKDGDPLFPIMPYNSYRHLTKDDLHAVIAYLRTVKPIAHEQPRTKLEFPLSLIVRVMPSPAPTPPAEAQNKGQYLSTVSGCVICHTPGHEGRQTPGMEFAGGMKFKLPNGMTVQSVNITPDKETGIGQWTREHFIQTFKRFVAPETAQISVEADGRNTVMPWFVYANMTEEDLGSIYDYLMTVKAIKNKVEKFPK